MAPSDYLKQCWLLITEVLRHSPKSNFTASAQATILYNEFENYMFEIITTFPKGQWVKTFLLATLSSLDVSVKPVWQVYFMSATFL